jgi:hypothetical protein
LIDLSHDVQEAETLTEESTGKSAPYEEMEISSLEGAHQSDEIQSLKNVTDKAEKFLVKVIRHSYHHILPLNRP